MSTIEFHVRPSVVLPDHRPLYKITQILLVLSLASHGKKSSLVRLQLFNWVLKDEKRRKRLIRASQDARIYFPAWGLDPTVDTALALAKADELIDETTTGVKLSLLGQDYCASVIKEGLFAEDREFLQQIGNSISEGMVADIVKRWG